MTTMPDAARESRAVADVSLGAVWAVGSADGAGAATTWGDLTPGSDFTTTADSVPTARLADPATTPPLGSGAAPAALDARLFARSAAAGDVSN